MAEDRPGVDTALRGTRFGPVQWVVHTGSTNDDLVRAAADGAPEGLVRVTDHQTQGRGRLGRRWVAPPGSSLMFSLLLRPPAPLATSGRLQLATMCVGLAVAEAARAVGGDAVQLKWPNDLVAAPDGRKLAGVLAEAVLDGGHGPAVVVGCGCNVNWPEELPEELSATAVSLNHLVGHDVDRGALLVDALRGVERRYAALVGNGPAGLLAEYRAECATIGTVVRVDLPAGPVVGRAVDVDERGALVVERPEGRVAVEVGDVVHLRPAPG